MEINNRLIIWTVVLIISSIDLNNGQILAENKVFCSGPKEMELLKEELKALKKHVGYQESRIGNLERELDSFKQSLSNHEEQQGATTSLVSREQSTIHVFKTNPTIQLTSASDIPVVETEGETETTQNSLSSTDTAKSAGISISRSFSSGRDDEEQQGTTASLVSREQSTIFETNPTIQLTSASDIPVVETEGESETRQESLSTTDTATYAETCGGTLIGQLPGYITSPNYPNFYPKYANCKWNIIVPNGYVVKLLVMYFSTERGFDYVQILDPIRETQIGRYSGTIPAGTVFYSSAESIVIRFSSDSSIQREGFYLQFEPSTRPKILKSTTTTDTITETMEPITIAETTTEPTSYNVQFSTSIGSEDNE